MNSIQWAFLEALKGQLVYLDLVITVVSPFEVVCNNAKKLRVQFYEMGCRVKKDGFWTEDDKLAYLALDKQVEALFGKE